MAKEIRTDKDWTRRVINRASYQGSFNINDVITHLPKGEYPYKAESDSRKEIHNLIESELRKGLSEEQIVAILRQNANYTKFAPFFQGWIKDRAKKRGKQLKNKGNDEEER